MMFKKGDIVEIKSNNEREFNLSKRGSGIGIVTQINLASFLPARTHYTVQRLTDRPWQITPINVGKFPTNMRLFND